MTFPPKIQLRFTACIAILAVLLLFVAPVVSKTLAERHQMLTPSQSHIMSRMGGMMHNDCSHHAMTTDIDMPGMLSSDGAACGYCDLLVHVPLLMWVYVPLIWLMIFLSLAPPQARREQPSRRRNTRVQHPRAPPFIAPV